MIVIITLNTHTPRLSLHSFTTSQIHMTSPSRFLGESNSSFSPSPSPSPSLDSDFLLILAALLCALICILGLVAVARCACLRRSSSPPRANKGIKKKTLRSLPKLTITAESAAIYSDCAICLSELVGGDEIRVLPQCGHGFHVWCIDKWLESHSSCPSCRQILVVGRCDRCGGRDQSRFLP